MAERRISKLLVENNKFCPGCGHGIINRVLADTLDEMNLSEKTVGALAVGCGCLMMDTFGIDWVQAPHGRAEPVPSRCRRCPSSDSRIPQPVRPRSFPKDSFRQEYRPAHG